MADWTRETPWRQGHVLANESSVALGVVRAEDAGAVLAVVISHDCDLAQSPETEPSVEIIVAKRVQAADGNFTHAKNSRRLHLECSIDGVETYLDMQAQSKMEIKKSALADHAPAANVVVKPEDRSILQRWLAARYRRAAFPDEFERRLDDTGVAKRIVKIVEPLGKQLVAVFFDVDDGIEQDRKSDDPGGNNWPRTPSGRLQIIATLSDPWWELSESEQESVKQRVGIVGRWGRVSTDTSFKDMNGTQDRQFASNGFGMQRWTYQ